MNLSLLIYLIGLADSVSVVTFIFAFMAALYAIGYYIFAYNVFDNSRGNDAAEIYASRIAKTKKIAILSAILWIVTAVIPSSGTVAAMYLVPKLAANQEIAKIPGNTAKLLNGLMQKYINDLSK